MDIYISKGKPLTPFQYESAAKFSDGVAIAQYDGKYGLLHVVEDKSTFYTKIEEVAKFSQLVALVLVSSS